MIVPWRCRKSHFHLVFISYLNLPKPWITIYDRKILSPVQCRNCLLKHREGVGIKLCRRIHCTEIKTKSIFWLSILRFLWSKDHRGSITPLFSVFWTWSSIPFLRANGTGVPYRFSISGYNFVRFQIRTLKIITPFFMEKRVCTLTNPVPIQTSLQEVSALAYLADTA